MDNDNAFAGGMIGCHDSDGRTSDELYKPMYPSVTNCLNRGSITVKGGTGYFGAMDGLAGGMVGYCYNNYTVFRNCVDDGTLSSDDICAHISGSSGSYDNPCYWTGGENRYGIHNKEDKGGYKPGVTVGDLNAAKFDAGWTTQGGYLDLDIIR